jgi:dihydroorotate dehydrogenase
MRATRREARRAGRCCCKIAPDLTLADLDDVVGVARRHRIDGMIVGNTTISRPNLRETAKANEQGGLSGRPLFALSTRMLAETYRARRGRVPADRRGRHRLRRGGLRQDQGRREPDAALQRADLSAASAVGAIKTDLLDFMRIGRLDSLSDAVGRDAAASPRSRGRSERRPRQSRIARRLQRAARAEEHQDRQPEPGIAERPHQPPAVK